MQMTENTAKSTEYTPDTPEKTSYQATLFSNRLAKQYKQLRKWARKNRVSCYRLYDRDIPEVPLALDLYTFLPQSVSDKLESARFTSEENTAYSENKSGTPSPYSPQNASYESDFLSRTYAHLYLYERPYDKPEDEEKIWLAQMAKAAASTLGIEESHVITKTRFIQRTVAAQSDTAEAACRRDASKKNDQYERIQTDRHITGTVQEQGQLFTVNLTDYIDTGLFFDHRPLRDKVRSSCAGKTVLNLFCYTGSFSVYAAEGKARFIESVDMSKTYLDWAKDNFTLNGFSDDEKYIFTRQDAVGFLNQKNAEVPNEAVTSKQPVFDKNNVRLTPNRYDIIILDPPTFSNSKRTDTTLDITRDWIALVADCLNLLTDKGTLYFSTNSRRLSFDEVELHAKTDRQFTCADITEETIPEDYRNSKIHRCWKLNLCV